MTKNLLAIIEIGSNNTKVHVYNNEEIIYENTITIEFKKNYMILKQIIISDLEKLYKEIDIVKKYTNDIHIFGCSIFRIISSEELDKINNNLLTTFNLKINVVSQNEEALLTAYGCYNDLPYKKNICIFIGGGGSTELIIVKNNKIIEQKYLDFGVVDITNKFITLKDDYPTCSFQEVYDYVSNLVGNIKIKCDLLILAGGDHLHWYKSAEYKLDKNTLYNNSKQPYMIDILTSNKYDQDALKKSLNNIKNNSNNPLWFDGARAMKILTNVISHKVSAKYIIPTKINMEDGLFKKIINKKSSWFIGNVEIKNKVVLAPMAGISNTSFRKIIKKMGAGLIYAEMVSDKAICYGNNKTLELLKMADEERPIVQQIFGSDISSFVESAKMVEKIMKPDIIDINMGCPVPKVALKAQAGSALLKNPKKIGEIVKNVVNSVSVPVTVKIRSGWDKNSINAVEIAKIVEESGASAIAIHARTRSEGYTGHADWNIIKLVKENVSIPVIGNGDVNSCYEAKRMLDETLCDAVMIGRGVLGNPWLIKECVDYIEKGIVPKEVTKKEKINMIKSHFELLCEDKNEKLALLQIRSHASWYLKGIPNTKEIKQKMLKVETKKELYDILNNIE